MLILVEGPDGAGKTTLIRQLGEKLPGLWHSIVRLAGRPTPQDCKLYYSWLYQLPTTLNLVCDRDRSVSDYIYSGISSDRPRPDIPMLYPYNLVVYCRPPMETIRHNIQNTPQANWVKPETIDEIVERYDTYFSEDHNATVRQYDYTDAHSLDRLISEITYAR